MVKNISGFIPKNYFPQPIRYIKEIPHLYSNSANAISDASWCAVFEGPNNTIYHMQLVPHWGDYDKITAIQLLEVQEDQTRVLLSKFRKNSQPLSMRKVLNYLDEKYLHSEKSIR